MIAFVQQQGSVFELRPLVRSAGARGGGQRGIITSFSKGSRRRLIDMFARLDTKGVRTSFLTLTFAGTPEPAAAKAAYRRFAERMKRRYAGVSWVWRMELQERGAIHFHILAFRLPYIPQRKLQQTWQECTREPLSIVHIKLLPTQRAAMNYCSKYISQLESEKGGASLDNVTYPHAERDTGTGRTWGILRRDLLPFAECLAAYVEGTDEIAYTRWAAGKMSRGRAIRYRAGCKLYHDDAHLFFCHLLRWVERCVVPDFDLWAEMRFSQRHE